MLNALLCWLSTFKSTLMSAAVRAIAKVKWHQRKELSAAQRAELRELLRQDYYIILTRRSNFLSCFFINLGHFVLTGRWGFYTHVLMNLEDEVNSDDDFRLIEAATSGVQLLTFEKMCAHCDAIALLRPKRLSLEDWTHAFDAARRQLGKPYDTLFDISNDQQLSCVELVRLALMAVPGYWEKFYHFEHRIARKRNLTPQMFFESPDFEVAWQARYQ